MSGFRTSRELVMQPDENSQPRMYVEQQKLKLFFPGWHLVGSAGKVNAAAGTLRPLETGDQYAMRITLSDKFPYEMPAVYTDGWAPRADCPHRYGTTQLCVMRGSQWTSTYTVAFMVAKTALWLAKYEVWRNTGRWTGNAQSHNSASSGGGFFDWLAGLFD